MTYRANDAILNAIFAQQYLTVLTILHYKDIKAREHNMNFINATLLMLITAGDTQKHHPFLFRIPIIQSSVATSDGWL